MKMKKRKLVLMLEMSEKLRFTDEFEISVHKKISNMKFGGCLSIETVAKTEEERKAIRKAIEKSAKYNCMVLRLHWLKDKNIVKVTHEI